MGFAISENVDLSSHFPQRGKGTLEEGGRGGGLCFEYGLHYIPTVKLPTGNHYGNIKDQVVGLIYGLSNHKSSLTNRVEGNAKNRKPQHHCLSRFSLALASLVVESKL